MTTNELPTLMPFDFPYLTEQSKEVARTELHEDESIRDDILRKFKALIGDDEKYAYPTDDEYLLRYLRYRKYNLQNAHSALRKHFDLRESYPDVYNNCDYDVVMKLITAGLMIMQPFRDIDGCAVFIVKMGDWDPDQFATCHFFKSIYVALMQALMYPVTQVHGVKIIADFKNFGLKQLTNYPLRYSRITAATMQGSLPIRMKEIHIVNASYTYRVIYAITKPFLGSKIRSRIFVHGEDFALLHDRITPTVLPQEYGGYLGSYDNTAWLEILRRHEKDIFAELRIITDRRKSNTR